MGKYIHKPVVFNLDNPYHRKVYEWISNETTNYSGFIFQTLAMRYEGTTILPTSGKSQSNINIDDWL